jgi:AcrR family transcriptional regulator
MSDQGPKPDRRKERASRRRSERKQTILAAARKVFSAKGYHASSVSDILAAAQIARGTFYLYFPSKRAIFEELLEQMFSQITGAVRRIRTGPGSDSALDQMLHNVVRIIDVLEGNRELTIILLREAVGVDSDFDQKLALFYGRLAAMVEGALRLGQLMGLVRQCDVRLVSYCVLGSLKEVMLKVLTGEESPTVPRDALAREILEYNLQGLFVPRSPRAAGPGEP